MELLSTVSTWLQSFIFVDAKEKNWSPTKFLDRHDGTESYSVIVLNLPINNKSNFIYICAGANKIVAADGGANRIYDLDLKDQDSKSTTPHAIVGDFDSIRENVWKHYEEAKIPFAHDPDQYSTDFTKSLKWLKRNVSPDKTDPSIVVFGGLGGRPDQAFAQLHQLYTAARNSELTTADLYLYTDEGIIFLLHEGRNSIDTSAWPDLITEKIGVIPIGEPAIITTQGLEWDVTNWHTSFGTQVSTSNHIRAKEVVVITNKPVFFTMELEFKD